MGAKCLTYQVIEQVSKVNWKENKREKAVFTFVGNSCEQITFLKVFSVDVFLCPRLKYFSYQHL